MSVSLNGTNGLTFSDATTQNTGGYTGFRNRIINGAMVIDQRNAGTSTSFTVNQNTYTLDRWTIQRVSFGSFTVQQSSTAPAGFANSLVATSTASDAANTGSTRCLISQHIEGYNTADLGWGTANAKAITLSFQVRSSLTGTFGGAIQNSDNTRSYPFSYTISSANTWTPISIVVAGDTSGTWLTTNGIGITVRFGLGTGPDIAGTSGVWASADYRSATGAVNVLGTNGATFYITGVQLEKGSVATPFEFRPYGTELQLCQRYYETGGSTYRNSGIGGVFSVPYVVKKRASATLTATGNYYASAEAVGRVFGTGGDALASFYIENTGNFTGAVWTASAEL